MNFKHQLNQVLALIMLILISPSCSSKKEGYNTQKGYIEAFMQKCNNYNSDTLKMNAKIWFDYTKSDSSIRLQVSWYNKFQRPTPKYVTNDYYLSKALGVSIFDKSDTAYFSSKPSIQQLIMGPPSNFILYNHHIRPKNISAIPFHEECSSEIELPNGKVVIQTGIDTSYGLTVVDSIFYNKTGIKGIVSHEKYEDGTEFKTQINYQFKEIANLDDSLASNFESKVMVPFDSRFEANLDSIESALNPYQSPQLTNLDLDSNASLNIQDSNIVINYFWFLSCKYCNLNFSFLDSIQSILQAINVHPIINLINPIDNPKHKNTQAIISNFSAPARQYLFCEDPKVFSRFKVSVFPSLDIIIGGKHIKRYSPPFVLEEVIEDIKNSLD